MAEAPYFDNINWKSFQRNWIIGGIVIFLSYCIFYLIWLRSPFMKLRTPIGKVITKNPFKFFHLMNLTIWSTN